MSSVHIGTFVSRNVSNVDAAVDAAVVAAAGEPPCYAIRTATVGGHASVYSVRVVWT